MMDDAAANGLTILEYRLNQAERETQRKADQKTVSALQDQVDQKADNDDVVALRKDVAGIRKLLMWLIGVVLAGSVTVTGSMFVLLAQHVK